LSDGSIVVCGVMGTAGSIDMAAGAVGGVINTGSLTFSGGGIIVRYSATGDVIWVRNPSFMNLTMLAADASDNIYVGGLISGNASTFMANAVGGDTTPFTPTKNSLTGDDGILIKMNPNGGAIWSRVIAGTSTNP